MIGTSGTETEFKMLKSYIRDLGCKTELQTRDGVEMFFKRITWSPLKDEYNKLTTTQKEQLIHNLYQELVIKQWP